ncbi:MAG: response regulator transcription factor [Limisphaerales bacterium]
MVGINQGCDDMRDKARILVIEDEPGVSMMAVYLLTQAGCEVQTAWNAEKGMQLAQTGGFSLITMSVNLPGMNGFEICRRLKQIPHLNNTPIVFVSDRATIENQQLALALGAVDYITKPFDALDFVSRILSHVSNNNDSGLVEAIPENSMA